MMNQFLRVYLKENFGITADFLPAGKFSLRPSDVIFHNGALPLKRIPKGSARLVIFHSGLDSAARLLWVSRGVTRFLSLSDPISEIHKNIKKMLKSKG
jgi:hypothetical protein